MQTLPPRNFHSHQTHASNQTDGHIWLSIENAKHITRSISDILSKHSPEYASQYAKNLHIILKKLDALQQENAARLRPYKNSLYLVYHDAFQYFEKDNQLNGAHFISSGPEHSPGIKRVRELRQLIADKNIQCIFYEPPNIPPLLHTLIEGSSAKLFAIDPIGSQLSAGKTLYFELMKQTAKQLDTCLQNANKII